MKNIENEIGENAGIVWQALKEQGSLPLTKLFRTTKLTDEQLWEALGWLARENKVTRSDTITGPVYKLGETNLIGKIGTDAGKVWKALQTYGECDVSQLTRFTNLSVYDVYAALGWLARENKIQAKSENHPRRFSLVRKEQQILA